MFVTIRPLSLYSTNLTTDYPIVTGTVSYSYDHANMPVSASCSTGISAYFGQYVKCKAVPLQARGGPEGSRKLRFPDFVTMAQDGGQVVSLTSRLPLPTGNIPGLLEAEPTPGP
jgi:hypothetical protein